MITKRHPCFLVTLAALTLLLLACTEKKENSSESNAETQQGEAKQTARVDEPKPATVDREIEAALPLAPDVPATKLELVPTPEDFEGEAEKTIAVENLEAELDRLEAEIIGVPN